MRLISALILLLVVDPLAAGDKLAEAIRSVTDAPQFKHAHWGILVVDAKAGAVLFEQNSVKLFVPASTTKLYSVATALDAFGADYRFHTPVVRRGEVDAAGRLAGDFILVAKGDPTMGGRTTNDGKIAFANHDHTYANDGAKGELTAPDPLAGIDDLARQVAKSGIRRVSGDVIVDDRFFEKTSSTGSGPGLVSPIRINDNVIDFAILPTEPGKPAIVEWRPKTRAVAVDARVETIETGGAVEVTIKAEPGERIVLRGKIPAGNKPLVRVHEVNDAATFARTLFIEALERAGVVVEASALAPNPTAKLPPNFEVRNLPKAAELVSPPFSELARLILKVSHNLHASTLPILVATKSGKRTLADGLRLQHDFLKRIGVDADTISFGGGAGGSRSDYTTPRATVQLLHAMAARPDYSAYHDALPILGVDGTLAEVVDPKSPARGQVYAKTGTLYWENTMNGNYLLTSKALAGYMTSASGRPLVFAAMVNNVHLAGSDETAEIGKTLGRLCEVIHANE